MNRYKVKYKGRMFIVEANTDKEAAEKVYRHISKTQVN